MWRQTPLLAIFEAEPRSRTECGGCTGWERTSEPVVPAQFDVDSCVCSVIATVLFGTDGVNWVCLVLLLELLATVFDDTSGVGGG